MHHVKVQLKGMGIRGEPSTGMIPIPLPDVLEKI
jgi:hypothetical protein